MKNDIIAYPTVVTEHFHHPRHTALPVIANSARDAAELILACHLAACHAVNTHPFDLAAAARDSLTASIDPRQDGLVTAIQDSESGFLWVRGAGVIFPERKPRSL